MFIYISKVSNRKFRVKFMQRNLEYVCQKMYFFFSFIFFVTISMFILSYGRGNSRFVLNKISYAERFIGIWENLSHENEEGLTFKVRRAEFCCIIVRLIKFWLHFKIWQKNWYTYIFFQVFLIVKNCERILIFWNLKNFKFFFSICVHFCN